ncbi:CU044_5270 family protein [Arthrobacter sp. RAF14]|uniref:CU044_5270 family protein n=1 Tax=Arthrobacter sp. RAF14 TaxID=3233051 RepID=UPI003F90BC3A
MDDLQLLREFRSESGAPAPESLAEGRERLMRTLEAQTATTLRWRTERNRTIRRRVILGAVAAGVAVAGVVAVEALRPPQLTASAEAAAVLNEAADAAIEASDPVLKPGQYLKVDMLMDSGGSYGQLRWSARSVTRTYVPADRSGTWVLKREKQIPLSFSSPEAKAFYGEAAAGAAHDKRPGNPFTGYVVRAKAGHFFDRPTTILNGIPIEEEATVTRDPKALLELIRQRTQGAGQSPDLEVLVTIADTLRTGVVPADLRAALFRAAALIPSAVLSDRQATMDGRTGTAVGVAVPGGITREEIVVDPGTGEMIGQRYVLLKAYQGDPAGTVHNEMSMRTSVVDSAP